MSVGLTFAQSAILVTASTVSCILSLLGSLAIIRLTWNQLRKESPNARILFQLSIYDVVVSTCLIFMPYGIPNEFGFPFSRGTTATCTALGFFIRWPLAVAPMSCILSLYYLLKLVYNWRDSDFLKYERPAYIVVFFIPTTTKVLA